MVLSVALLMLFGFFAISRSVNVVSESRAAIEATDAQSNAANDVLGYAVGIKRLDSRDVPTQYVIALRDALDRVRTLHGSDLASRGTAVGSASESGRLTDLYAQADAAFDDFARSTQRVLDAVVPGAALQLGASALPIDHVAATQASFEDALRNVRDSYADRLARATAQARTEEALLTLSIVLLVGLEIAFLIAPAHRAYSRRLERSVRAQEQDARLSSEIARDVAERDRREAQAQFRALFRETGIGVALTDEFGNILDSNPALQQILGYTASELRTHRFGQWVRNESDSTPWPDAEWAGALPGNASRELEYFRKDGTRIWVQESVSRATREGQASIWIGMAQDISARKKAEERLIYQATTDTLTGLPNLSSFQEALERAFRRATITPTEPFAVAIIDLDRFKHVNDSRGHRFGDAVLAEVGRQIAHWARPQDFVARIGGDEFAAVLAGVNEPDFAVARVSALLNVLDGPLSVHGARVAAQASVGICLWSPTFASADDLVQAADAGAYRAKAAGRAQCIVFDARMAADSRARVRLAQDLRLAVRRGELWVAYQPIFKLGGRHCVGFEALARWAHPELGDISPEIFVPVAEESGCIEPIGQWVMREACLQLSEWRHRHPTSDIAMHVNLSAQQLANPNLEAELDAVLQEANVPGSALSLELTESMMLESSRSTVEMLKGLHDQRIRLVLDDFGTGYSSLGYFHNLPVDGIKIDKGFIIGADGRLAAPHIVRALVGLAGPLGIDVVAEGVESAHQADELAALGCSLGQGYLLSRPLDAVRASEFLERSVRREPLAVSLV